MAIKVLIKRKFKEGTAKDAYNLLMQLRAVSTIAPGFVSGQTLISAKDTHELLVISTWTGKKRWEEWRATDKRKEISNKIAELLETPEHYEIFFVGEEVAEWVQTS